MSLQRDWHTVETHLIKLVRPGLIESIKKRFFYGNLGNPEILKLHFSMKNKYFSSGFFLTSIFTSETHESGIYHSIFLVHGGTPPSPEDGIALAGSSITQSSDINPGRSNFKGPFFYLDFAIFWWEVNKNVPARKSPYPGIDSSSNQCSWSDVRGTWRGSWEISREKTDEVRRFAPLPRTVYLVLKPGPKIHRASAGQPQEGRSS